ncbi:MAG: UDP-glucose 4-epimerase GalE [Bacilli bacterium]|nr:UDP-glucose 4-epimerase GalE [Bacilli bacterium]
MKVLVTGCCGYIGSHTCVELLDNNYEVIGLDNFSNSKKEVLDKIKRITSKSIKFYEGNMLNEELLSRIFVENKIDAVIDFAAYKAVGESISIPIDYYINNVSSVLILLKVMKKYKCKRLVFSSSATVYGTPNKVPITEDSPIGGTTNPYGTSKLMVEHILKDVYKSDPTWDICILRYFNPIGAHSSSLLGENPNGIPANLLPYITRVANGKLAELSVFGDDYDTKDGTGIRDYIHVVDLARGHIKALQKLEKEKKGLYIYNLGTGTGYSVLDIVRTFEKTNDMKIKYRIAPRREGDVASCYADPSKAREELGFECEKTLVDMLKDAWNFEKRNF